MRPFCAPLTNLLQSPLEFRTRIRELLERRLLLVHAPFERRLRGGRLRDPLRVLAGSLRERQRVLHHGETLLEKNRESESHSAFEELGSGLRRRRRRRRNTHQLFVQLLVELAHSKARHCGPVRIVRAHCVRVGALCVEQELAPCLEHRRKIRRYRHELDLLAANSTELVERKVEAREVPRQRAGSVQRRAVDDVATLAQEMLRGVWVTRKYEARGLAAVRNDTLER